MPIFNTQNLPPDADYHGSENVSIEVDAPEI